MLPHTYLLTNKVNNKLYPAKHYMKKFKSEISSSCSFCDDSVETVRLFWHCPFTKTFWQDVLRFIRVTFIMNVFCYGRMWYWVLLSMNNLKGNRCKYLNSRPLFFVFIKYFSVTLSLMTSLNFIL